MKNRKLLIGIVAVLVIVLGAYLYFSGNSQTKAPVTNTLASSNTGANPVALGGTTTASSFAGSDIASMLKNISQIKLNTSVLQNPAFLTLVDTTLALPQTTVSGRINPFGRSGVLDSAAPVSSSQINGTVTETSTTTPTTPVTTTPAVPKKP